MKADELEIRSVINDAWDIWMADREDPPTDYQEGIWRGVVEGIKMGWKAAYEFYVKEGAI